MHYIHLAPTTTPQVTAFSCIKMQRGNRMWSGSERASEQRKPHSLCLLQGTCSVYGGHVTFWGTRHRQKLISPVRDIGSMSSRQHVSDRARWTIQKHHQQLGNLKICFRCCQSWCYPSEIVTSFSWNQLRISSKSSSTWAQGQECPLQSPVQVTDEPAVCCSPKEPETLVFSPLMQFPTPCHFSENSQAPSPMVASELLHYNRNLNWEVTL